MARYCFYCGRELTVGERCHCKDPSKAGPYKSAGSSAQKESTGGSGPSYAYQTAGAGEKAGFGSTSAGAKARSSTKTRHSRASWNKKSSKTAESIFDRVGRLQQRVFRLRTFRDQVLTLFPNITKGFSSGIQYLTRPASKIRQESMRIKRSYSYFYVAAFSILSGLLALLMSRSGSPLFSNLIAVVFGSGQSLLYTNPFLSFTGLTVLSFLFVMTMGVSFYIAARFSNRKPTFRKIMDLVSISLVYLMIMESFILITILMGSRGSLSLIFVSLLLMGVTHLLSFRNALGLTEDTVFFFLIFVYIFCYILFKFLLYLSAQLIIFT